jgi:SpoVK/Ycf46/Vps4 family AAA+-type ATPase
MIGLSALKTSILNQLIYFLQEPILCEKKRGYKHTVLCGPPGTGKTEIAKIIGKMYSKLGVLSVKTTIAKVDELIVNKKEPFPFKKVTRSDLIAGYVGQTAIKTRDVIKECLGGCLFIDEAYSLGTSCDNDGFSKECIDTLCEAMSDHKDDLMVIIAGYEEELKSQFFSANPGLESRFVWKFTIDKYSPEEMRQILEKKVAEEGWTLEMDKKTQLNWIEKNKDDFKYYGRDMEQLLLHVKVVHSRRIYGKSHDLCKRITMDDLENGRKAFIEHQTNKKSKMSESMYGLYL